MPLPDMRNANWMNDFEHRSGLRLDFVLNSFRVHDTTPSDTASGRRGLRGGEDPPRLVRGGVENPETRTPVDPLKGKPGAGGGGGHPTWRVGGFN